MSAIDDVTEAVNASDKLDAPTKAILTEFLQAAGPVLSNVSAEGVSDLFASIAGGDPGGAVAIVSQSLSPQQVVVLLDAEQQRLDALVANKGSSVVAAQGALTALENAALALLAKTIVAAL